MNRRIGVYKSRVTYVPGLICHLCTRFKPSIFLDRFGRDSAPPSQVAI
jgi:hypothetical protein